MNDNNCYEEIQKYFIKLWKKSLLLNDNDDENSASTTKTSNLMQHASVKLNKDDMNTCVTYDYDNIIGVNDNDIDICKRHIVRTLV